MKKILTFIIVTWNNQDTIIDCLDSIYKYCNNFKIIIVDNNSSDNTIDVINNKHYKDCKIIQSNENLGFAGGNNLGLKYVSTEYICYLNPDTILLEDIIASSINILKSDDTIGIVGCKLLYNNLKLQKSTFNFDNSKQVIFENLRISKIFPNFVNERYFPYDSKCKRSKYVEWLIGAEMILKTRDAIEIGGFSTDYYMYTEDMDICMKMYKILNKKCYYVSDCSLIHIGGVSESYNTNYNKYRIILRNKLLFVKKYYSSNELRKTYYNMCFTYRIRYVISLLLLPFMYKKANYYKDKMKKGLEILKSLKGELEVV